MSGAPIESGRGTRRVVGGREWILFGGCDYLGLAGEPALLAAARAGLERDALSPGGSRTTTGTHREHLALERELARFLGAPAVCLLADGMLANLAALEALAPRVEAALFDAAAHPTLRRAALAAGLLPIRTPHADAARAAELAADHAPAALLVDGYYPMRGELAPLEAYRRALPAGTPWVVDDAHATGVVGARGRGSAESLDLAEPGVLLTGTLSKALGTQGGFVAGGEDLVAAARRSEAYVCTTPIPAHLAAAARAGLALLAEDPPRPLLALRANLAHLDRGLAERGSALRLHGLPVLALAVDDPARLLALEDALERHRLLVPRVEYPGQRAGLRLSVSAAHTERDLDRLAEALAEGLGVG